MAGEAVSGRYGAARHAVADEGGPRRHPSTDGRSLVDRLLADGGDDRAFDWDWGDPGSGDRVADEEPMHDIPELWAPREGPAREVGEPDNPEDRPFPTPRLHGDSSLDGPLDGISSDDGFGRPEPRRADAFRSDGDDRDWSDRSLDDLGSDDWGTLGPELDDRRLDDQRFDGGPLDGDPLD